MDIPESQRELWAQWEEKGKKQNPLRNMVVAGHPSFSKTCLVLLAEMRVFYWRWELPEDAFTAAALSLPGRGGYREKAEE